MSLDPLALSRLVHDFEAVEVLSHVTQPSHRDAALWYARIYRWPVFPIVPRGKKPLTQHGFLEATTDTAQIIEWFSRWPDANLATPTGAEGCGFDVVDIDGPAGMESLTTFADELDIRAIAFTPGDGVERQPGRHLYIPATGDGNATKFAPGCDYRGAGGYVCIPPSVALHGVRYAWLHAPETSA
jgi:hypothetical protein